MDTVLLAQIDHLVVASPSLHIGADYLSKTLGVSPTKGGEHVRMGTHNLLLRLGDDIYLEVISINPSANGVDRPRWFGLDSRPTGLPPRLVAWVARTNDIQKASISVHGKLGEVEEMSRSLLHWLITIPPDGTVPFDGVAPMLIQWISNPHPVASLPECGCSLLKLEGLHCDAANIGTMLQSLGFQDKFVVSPVSRNIGASLVAHIQTPRGVVALTT